jgi:hypothetical protein
LLCETTEEGDESEAEAMNCDDQQSNEDPTRKQDNTPRIEYSSQQDDEDSSLPTDINMTTRVNRQVVFSAEPQQNGIYPIFHSRDAPTDLDNQYNRTLDPDGGDSD